MDEKTKPFDTVSIVLLMLLSVGNDGLEIIFDLLAATGVGIGGEAIMEPINIAMDAIVTFWFFAKCGFGGPSIAQLLDDILEVVGIPGRTICVGFGIYLANNPNSFLGKIGGTVAAIETGGEGALAKEAGGAMKTGEAEIKKVSKKAPNEVESQAEKASFGVEVAPSTAAAPATTSQEAGDAAKKEKEEQQKKIEESMESEAQKSPVIIMQERLLEQSPQNAENKAPGENAPAGAPKKSNVVPFEDIRRQRAQEVKENLEHPKTPREVTDEERAA